MARASPYRGSFSRMAKAHSMSLVAESLSAIFLSCLLLTSIVCLECVALRIGMSRMLESVRRCARSTNPSVGVVCRVRYKDLRYRYTHNQVHRCALCTVSALDCAWTRFNSLSFHET